MVGDKGASTLGLRGGDDGVITAVGMDGDGGRLGFLDLIPKRDPKRCFNFDVVEVDPGLDLLIAVTMLSLVGEASAIADVGDNGADSARDGLLISSFGVDFFSDEGDSFDSLDPVEVGEPVGEVAAASRDLADLRLVMEGELECVLSFFFFLWWPDP
jgi:hypothetical protein